ncbi:MAG: glycine--tRNA ligase subunit beta, partial [Dokdonella sp.]
MSNGLLSGIAGPPPSNLLVEIGTEELPPGSLDELARVFAERLIEALDDNKLLLGQGEAKVFCSPRRIAVLVTRVSDRQPVMPMFVHRGPPVAAGLDKDGSPTRALTGFALKHGVEVSALHVEETEKGSWYIFKTDIPASRTATELVPAVVGRALEKLPIPKPMRWGDHDYAFVRPVHWIVVLHGEQVIDVDLMGVKSGRMSRGHRFHHPQPVHIVDADSWLDALHAAKVIADPTARRARVRSEVERVAVQAGGVPRLSAGLLDEIANLTEWPVAIACTFDREFLAVPQEALVMTMETNQKFVPVFDANGMLTEHFIGVANIESKDPAEIRKGYERVIRPRFADAKFFYDEDLKTPLAGYQEGLKNVTYQQALGSVWDKSVRVAELARVIGNRVGVDAALATRAAALSKCDLLTRMVGEFPELQGVMGRYYATASGEHAEVAAALDEFYAPRFAGDKIAQGKVGQVLAVAERLDTLAGIFAVGMKPSGNKDPFALRRAALGLARTLIEGDLQFDLDAQLAEALALLPDSALAAGLPKGKDGKTSTLDAGKRRSELAADLRDFILDRMRGYYADQGISGEAFEAVRALAPSDLTDFDRRLRAVVEFTKFPEAQALAAANKRIGNILRQAGAGALTKIDDALLDAGVERELAVELQAAQTDGAPLIATRDYVGL